MSGFLDKDRPSAQYQAPDNSNTAMPFVVMIFAAFLLIAAAYFIDKGLVAIQQFWFEVAVPQFHAIAAFFGFS